MHADEIQVLVISLDRRPDRWAKFMKLASAANMQNVQRLSAVDAKTFVAHQHPSISLLSAHNILKGMRRSHYEIDSAGAVGASLSHIKAWEYLQNSTASAVIVFEDDAEIPVDFNERLTKVIEDLETLNGDWDMVSFYNTPYGDGQHGCVAEPKEKPWYNCTSLMGAHAYMISRRGSARLLARAYPIEMHVDAYIAFMSRMSHIKMLWNPAMQIAQPFNDSDIAHGNTDILNVPTNMKKQGIIALEITSVIGMMAMAAIAGGLLSLAYVVRKR
jgi:GR25 family glycosyltransferase involved in LPS biosynthesis